SDGRLTFPDWCDHRHGNKLTYTPPANVNGLVEFKFMVNDGDADSISEYPFVIKMTAVNDPPIVSDSNVETDEDTPHPFAVSDFGFTDVDSDTTIPQDTYLNATLQSITITSLPGTGKGTLELNNQTITDLNQIVTKSQLEAGALKYHPPLNANGNHFASFQFKANDGMDDSTNTATMTITVKPKNDAPEAEDDDFEIDANTSLNELDVLENDRDLNEDSLSITVKTTPSHGTATIDSSGSRSVISYSPDLNFIGTDTFNYTISDGQDPPLTDTAAVTVTVVPKLEGPDSSDFAAPAEAELLVSNMEQGDDSNHYPRGSRIIYQQFSTGNNRRGYDVKSVTLRFKANVPTIQRDLKFEIREGIPQSTRICTLGKPSSRMRGDRTFSAADCPNLDKNKSYYLTIITSQSDKLVRVSSNREASGKAPGWSISNGSRTLSG
ncbi:MAG: tandem-95 repeat protein, partial [Aphanocapsa feldmannii 288cV]